MHLPVKVDHIFITQFAGTFYVTVFDGRQYLGRLQISKDPSSAAWRRRFELKLAEGEATLAMLRDGLPPQSLIAWETRLRFQTPDRVELHGSGQGWRLIVIHPLPLSQPSAQDQVEAFAHLQNLRGLIWLD